MKKLKPLLLACVLVLFLSATHTALAAEPLPLKTASSGERAVSFELLGRGGIYSISFDHMIGNDIALGIGTSYTPIPTVGSVFFLPVYANWYPLRSGDGTSRLLLTGGMTYSSVFNSDFNSSLTGFNPSFGLGYEYRGQSGFLFRATGYVLRIAGTSSTDLQTGFTRITSYVTSPWVGFGFGYSF